MKKILYSISCLAAIALTGIISSCQNEEFKNESIEDVQTVKAVAIGSFDKETRTSFELTNSNINLKWSEGDKIVIISEDGKRNIGVMSLEEGQGNSSYGKFSGILKTRPTDKTVHVYYMGELLKEDAVLKSLTKSKEFNISSQNETSKGSLSNYGIMHATADIKRSEAGVSLDFNVVSLLTYAHYSFHLPSGVNASNETVSISGDNVINQFNLLFEDASITDKVAGQITVAPEWNGENGSAYMVYVPADDMGRVFEVTIGGKTYKGSLATNSYKPNDFIVGNTPAYGKDVYFSEDGAWTITYMNGDEVFKTDSKNNNFGPSQEFTITSEDPTMAAAAGAAPYVFAGWAESKGGEVKYHGGETLTLNRPETTKTLYAVYTQDNAAKSFTLIAKHVGRTMDDTEKTVSGTWPTTVTLSSTLAVTSDNDYDFVGYYKDLGCTQPITTVAFNYNSTSETVYCKWEEKKYTVVLIGHKNAVDATGDYSKSVTDIENTLPFTMSISKLDSYKNEISRQGYTCVGFSLKQNGTEADVVSDVTFTKSDLKGSGSDIKAEINVYAVWKPNGSNAAVTAPSSTGVAYQNK